MNSNWVDAGDLKIGDKIKQADGTTGVVANVTTIGQTQEMFNLTVWNSPGNSKRLKRYGQPVETAKLKVARKGDEDVYVHLSSLPIGELND